MAEFFNRDLRILVGGFSIETRSQTADETANILKVEFKIERTLKKEPNTCELKIYNLSEDTRTKLGVENTLIQVEAGYFKDRSQIFKGDIDFAHHERVGPDWITKVEAKDGGQRYRTARSSVSFKPGATVRSVIESLIRDLGIPADNALKKLKEGQFRDGITEFSKGFSASGATQKILDERMRSAGIEWSVQDNELQFLRAGEGLQQIAKLSAETGLIGSPEPGEGGVLRVRTLIRSGITPGCRIDLQAQNIKGTFKVSKVTYSGDTRGNNWYADLECVRPET